MSLKNISGLLSAVVLTVGLFGFAHEGEPKDPNHKHPKLAFAHEGEPKDPNHKHPKLAFAHEGEHKDPNHKYPKTA